MANLIQEFNQKLHAGFLEEAAAIAERAEQIPGYPQSLLRHMKSILVQHGINQRSERSNIPGCEPLNQQAIPAYNYHRLTHLLEPESGVPSIQVSTAQDRYLDYSENPELISPIKTIAFYLPQFHPFKENDEWWGKGFTEWSNVGKSTPVFSGHHQPHCPIHLGYYDLRIVENMVEQAKLAKNYGIHGFSYYFYWFDGHTLMERPLRNMLEDPSVEMPFCLTWANENWTRRWDGQENDILIAQNHSIEDSIRLFKHLIEYFRDSRYIRHRERPVFIVYRPDIIPNILEITTVWRELAAEAGFEGLYLIGCQTFGITDVRGLGFDAAVEFPPHAVGSPDIKSDLKDVDADFSGHIYDYNIVAKSKINEGIASFPKHYTCMLSWDNTARKGLKSHIFARFNLAQYQDWLSSNIAKTLHQSRYSDDYPLFTFINAWNEWAEGTHLEPDRKYGYSYLQATHAVLKQHASPYDNLDTLIKQTDPRDDKSIQKENCIILHCHYLDALPSITNHIQSLPDTFDIYVTATTLPTAIAIKEQCPNFIVEVTPNIGRDIAPFIHTLRSLATSGLEYKACLKLHTKKSVYRSDGSELREKLLSQLFDPATIDTALSSLGGPMQAGNTGMICPAAFLIDHTDPNGYRLKYHIEAIEELEQVMGFTFHRSVFPAGSMFWFSQKSMQRLLSVSLSSFDPEIGLADGTIAHTIERIFATIVQFDGYRVMAAGD
jgi:lipopolysaccharide biosynthesis protein